MKYGGEFLRGNGRKMRGKFFITDVFGVEKYTGNQLATFIDCRAFSDKEMQQIAREFNYSETSFVLSGLKNGAYDVRIFTSECEIDFAGHPTLGTAFIIRRFLQLEPTEEIRLNLKIGQIPVSVPLPPQDLSSPLWMKQVAPRFGRTFAPQVLAPVLSLSESAFNKDLPIQEVTTGLPFMIVPLNTMEDLRKAFIDPRRYKELLAQSDAKGILIFCAPGYNQDQDLAARVFVPCLGVPEDPATGSANGCLMGYLLRNGYRGQTRLQLTVGQGYEIGRPSQLYLRGQKIDGMIEIHVGGKVLLIAQGEWD